MARRVVTSTRAATRWTVRIIPFFLIGAFGVTTYVVISRLCVDYLIRRRSKTGLAAGLLVLYSLFLILTIATYLRTFITVQRDPGLVPLLSEAQTNEKGNHQQRGSRDVEQRPAWVPDPDPDSPGLEQFYTKDVFVCEADGRPKWCSECLQWKPDRAHHSSELGRCVRKMDHMCPWVGGMVSETSFNFFTQFTLYTACFCAVVLSTAAYCVSLQTEQEQKIDGWSIAVIVLSAFFGFFTFAMFLTSLRYIASNITNVDMLRRHQAPSLAVRIPLDSPLSPRYQTIMYPLRSTWPPASSSSGPTTASRDQRAVRRFAILHAESRENPWDLGLWHNFKAVMGNNLLEWLLPIRHSPCCDHDSMESDYALGAVVPKLRERVGLAVAGHESDQGIEMRERQ